MDIGHDIMHCRYTASVNTYPGYIEMLDIQGESKKSGISKTIAINPLKSIRNGKSWCVSENSGLMLQDMQQTFQI